MSIWLIIQRIPTIETMLSKNISFGEIWSLAADQPITITIVLSSTTSKGQKRMLSTIKMVPSKYKARQYLQNYMISHSWRKKLGIQMCLAAYFLGDCCAVHHNFMLPAITGPKCVKLRCLEVWSLFQGGVLTWAQITRSQYYKNTCTIYQYHKSWMDTLHYTSISSIRESLLNFDQMPINQLLSGRRLPKYSMKNISIS